MNESISCTVARLSLAASAVHRGRRGRALVIGNFDGVHRGHRALLQKLVSVARERSLTPAVLSFYPHPSVVLGRVQQVSSLTSLRQKKALMGDIGVQELLLLHFSPSVRELSAESFLQQIVIDMLGVQYLLLGYDTRFGKDRQGDAASIEAFLKRQEISVEQFGAERDHEAVIASRRIRAAIEQGALDDAKRMLGRNYAVRGRVVHGDGRGAQIGFPTLNLHTGSARSTNNTIFPSRVVLPPLGVYAGFATVPGVKTAVAAVANLGLRPTFAPSRSEVRTPRLEVHLLENDSDKPYELYGVSVEFSFVAKLRDEQRFSSVDALRTQIAADIQNAKELLRTV